MHYVCAHYFSPFCDIGCPCYTPKDTTLKFKENTDKGERSNKADEGEGMHEGVHESEGMCEGKGAVDEDEVEDKDDDESEDEDEDEGESKSESEDESESDTNSERECESESESSSSHTDKTSHCTSSSSTSTSTSTSTGSTYSLCTLPTTTIPTPSTTVTITTISTTTPNSTPTSIFHLPDELLLPIMRYIVEPPAITPKLRKKQHKYLFCFASQHRVFWRIFCDPSFVTYHNFVRGKKDYLHMTCPRDHIVVAAVLHRINLLLERAHEFVHEYHTCINEAINSWRTKDVPKSIFFGSTYIERTWLSVLRWNLGGPGAALAAIWRQLGLSITSVEQSHFDQMDKRLHDDRTRQSSQAHHTRTLELAQERGELRKEEIHVSKEKRDEYRTANNKTALFANVSSSHQRGRHQQPARDPATLTPAEASSVKGAELKRVMRHFNLPIKIMGETADGQRKRLKLYLEKRASGNSPAADSAVAPSAPGPSPLPETSTLPSSASLSPSTSSSSSSSPSSPAPSSSSHKRLHRDFNTLTPANASSVKGADLTAAMRHFGLTIKITGETADGQRKRLKSYLESNVSPQAEAALSLVSPAPPLSSPPPSLSSTSSSTSISSSSIFRLPPVPSSKRQQNSSSTPPSSDDSSPRKKRRVEAPRPPELMLVT